MRSPFPKLSDSPVLKLPTFNPDSIPGQVCVWEVSDGNAISLASGKVESQRDMVGNNHIVSLKTSTRPTYFATGGPNNLPYIQLQNAQIFSVTPFVLRSSPFTVYMVARLTNNNLNIRFFTYNSNGSSVLLAFNTPTD